MGTILTVMQSVLIFMFFYSKLLTIINRHEVDIMSAVNQNELTSDYEFKAEDGFFAAAALTRFDSNPEIIEDWTYGELVISKFGWGYDLNENIEAQRQRLDYHYCSDEELGLEVGKKTKVYPLDESSMGELKLYRKKFKCIPD